MLRPLLACLIWCFFASTGIPLLAEGSEELTPMPREFRGVWVASVYNIDWPSSPGLPVESQKAELIRILDLVKSLNMNAVVLQVRPAGDALYDSPYEPWAFWVSGRMGRAPEPYYDPLAFAVEEAHKRCLELHAWVNPYRAATGSEGKISEDHVTRAHPNWIITYGPLKWLDPGRPEVHAHVVKVVRDIVRRYDIDGLHIDDYFYPYPRYTKGRLIDFPDNASYQAYRDQGGTLEKGDWRRDNVNSMVQALNKAVHEEKPWVKFGVSPFGIWKPGVPEGTMAYMDACNHIYADSRYWLQKGWLDYCSPQLYWSRDSEEQPFEPLLKWWNSQNTMNRHLWPGLATDRVGAKRRPDEMVAQVMLTRNATQHPGHVQWNIKPLLEDRLGVADLMKAKVYQEEALVPASPWLRPGGVAAREAAPALHLEKVGDRTKVSWSFAKGNAVPKLWILSWERDGQWRRVVLPGITESYLVPGVALQAVDLSKVDRYGQLGQPVRMVLHDGSVTRPLVFSEKKH